MYTSNNNKLCIVQVSQQPTDFGAPPRLLRACLELGEMLTLPVRMALVGSPTCVTEPESTLRSSLWRRARYDGRAIPHPSGRLISAGASMTSHFFLDMLGRRYELDGDLHRPLDFFVFPPLCTSAFADTTDRKGDSQVVQ